MSSDPDDAVSVFRAANVTEAHLVKNLLLDRGIEATVTDEHEPLAGLPIMWPDVMVRRADQARAAVVVGEYEQQDKQQKTDSTWTCPICRESVPATFDECFNCGAERPDSA